MQLTENFSLKPYNTYGIPVMAKYFAAFANTDVLAELLETKKEHHLILGGGSNILFTKNYDGLVLKNEISGIEKINEDDAHVYLRAGAGVGWHEFVLYCSIIILQE